MTYIAVVGPGEASEAERDAARVVGRELAARGALIVTGGLGGVMEAACAGAKEGGGTTVGILAGVHRSDANPYVDVAIPTGLGQARNAIVVRAADAVIAIGRGYGTLSEIAFALRGETRVVGVGTWEIEGVEPADTPEAAVDAVLQEPLT